MKTEEDPGITKMVIIKIKNTYLETMSQNTEKNSKETSNQIERTLTISQEKIPSEKTIDNKTTKKNPMFILIIITEIMSSIKIREAQDPLIDIMVTIRGVFRDNLTS